MAHTVLFCAALLVSSSFRRARGELAFHIPDTFENDGNKTLLPVSDAWSGSGGFQGKIAEVRMYDAAVSGTTSQQPDFILNDVVDFGRLGAEDYMLVDPSSVPNMSDGFSLASWFLPTGQAPGGGSGTVAMRSSTFHLGVTAEGLPIATVSTRDGGYGGAPLLGTEVPLYTWTHLCLRVRVNGRFNEAMEEIHIDQSVSEEIQIDLFVDGALVESAKLPNREKLHVEGDERVSLGGPSPPESDHIGRKDMHQIFRGKIAGTRLYGSWISDAEISKLAADKPDGLGAWEAVRARLGLVWIIVILLAIPCACLYGYAVKVGMMQNALARARATPSSSSVELAEGVAPSPFAGDASNLQTWLEKHGLGGYYAALMSQGYDDVSIFVTMSPREIEGMFDAAAVLPGHRIKFRQAVQASGVKLYKNTCPQERRH